MGNEEMDWKWSLNLSNTGSAQEELRARAAYVSATKSWHTLELSCVEMLYSPV